MTTVMVMQLSLNLQRLLVMHVTARSHFVIYTWLPMQARNRAG